MLKHFFGYTEVPAHSEDRNEDIRVRLQAERLRAGPRFDLNLILVGHDALPEHVDRTQDRNIAYARRLYASAGIAIGRIKRSRISVAKADGLEHIDSTSEACELWESFSSPDDHNGIDVFVVHSYRQDGEHKGGRSPVDGSCNNDGKDSGLLVTFNGGEANFAHEIGHYLGLNHPEPTAANLDNPMFEGIGASAAARFSAEQAAIMHEHCMMRGPCP